MIICFYDDIRVVNKLVKHLLGQHDQSTHGNRFRTIAGKPRLIHRGGQTGVLNYDHEGNPLSFGPEPSPKDKNTQLEDALEEKYGHTMFDFKGISEDHAQRIHDKINELFDKYPDVARQVLYVGNGLNPDKMIHKFVKYQKEKIDEKTALATCSSWETKYSSMSMSNSSIMFNNKHMSKPNLDAKLKSYEKQKWHVAGDIEGLFTHEFGHAVNYHMFFAGKNQSFLPFINKVTGEGEVSATTYKWEDQMASTGDTLSGYAKKGGKLEHFAEGFSALHSPQGNKNHPYVKKLQKLLDSAYGDNGPMNSKNNSPTKKPPSKLTISPGSPKEKQIKKFYESLYKSSVMLWKDVKKKIEELMPSHWIEELPPGPPPSDWNPDELSK